MTIKENRLLKATQTTLVSQGFRILSLAISLVSVPLYLKWLGQERYGLMLTGSSLIGYLMFSNCGLNWASMLLIAQAHGKKDQPAIQSIVRNSLSLAVFSVLVAASMTLILYFTLVDNLNVHFLPPHPEMPGIILGLGVVATVRLLISPIYNLFSGLQDTPVVAAYQGIATLLNTLFMIYVAYLGLSLGWLFTLGAMGTVFCGCIAAIHCFFKHRWAFAIGPVWESRHIRDQFRSGAKSLVMQVGVVMTTTAPVLSISSTIGPEWVPLYSIPMTLLSIPLSLILQLNGNLQPAYGQAIGEGDKEWIRSTVMTMLRRVFVFLGIVGTGFIALNSQFIFAWTGGDIDVSSTMTICVFVSGGISACGAVYRGALAGMNRHRYAAIGDILCGFATIAIAPIVINTFGVAWIGLAASFASLATVGWMFPLQFRRFAGDHVQGTGSNHFTIPLLLTCVMAAISTSISNTYTAALPPIIAMTATALSCCVVFLFVGYRLGLTDVRQFVGWSVRRIQILPHAQS